MKHHGCTVCATASTRPASHVPVLDPPDLVRPLQDRAACEAAMEAALRDLPNVTQPAWGLRGV